jgi:phenylalanyl-tRNA synthetase beta chain
MLLVESWLRSFVNPALNTAELAHALTMSGAEVESIRPVAPAFSGIIVGHILSAEKHPDADKLKICTVDIGEDEPLQIVCGAPNAAVGMKAPLATVGAILPDGSTIGKGKLRGVDSFGMLCSQRELGLSTDSGGLWRLPDSAIAGQDIRVAMALDDTVLEIKLTPNKADCLSVWGMARETAAITGAALLPRPAVNPVVATISDTLPISIAPNASDLCGQFSGRIIKGVSNNPATHPSPAWLVSRLERAGQRSISPLVDISNYVMLELGRPSHVFDLAKLNGGDVANSGLNIRWAQDGESLTLLNGTTIALDPSMGVIADANGAQALAGIMGGDFTAVGETTTDIYLEAAFWNPAAIQGRARKLGFSSDAAHRFERGVDFATTTQDLELITDLILKICGGECGPVNSVTTVLPARKPVALRVARCNKVLGITLTTEQISDIFTRLGFEYAVTESITTATTATTATTIITVTPPSYRFDLEIEEDLIEEVARLYGFDNIPANPPVAEQTMQAQPEGTRSLHSLRIAMAQRDYMEAINYSFVDASWERDFAGNTAPITLLNPIASTMSVMRSSQLGGLVANVKHHISHRINRVRMFELGKVFLRDASVAASDTTVAGYDQPQKLCAIAYGTLALQQWGLGSRNVDFYDLKADLDALCPDLSYAKAEHIALHPGRSAAVSRHGKVIGYIGELHPKLCQSYALTHAPVVFEVDAAALCSRALPLHQEIAKTPMIERDLAVVVDAALPAQALIDAIHTAKNTTSSALAHLVSVSVFDQFKGGSLPVDKKSLALRLRLQDPSNTLTDAQSDAALTAALDTLQTVCGAVLR